MKSPKIIKANLSAKVVDNGHSRAEIRRCEKMRETMSNWSVTLSRISYVIFILSFLLIGIGFKALNEHFINVGMIGVGIATPFYLIGHWLH